MHVSTKRIQSQNFLLNNSKVFFFGVPKQMHLPLFNCSFVGASGYILMQQIDLQVSPGPKVSVNELTQVLTEGEESWTNHVFIATSRPHASFGPPNGGENYGKSLILGKSRLAKCFYLAR